MFIIDDTYISPSPPTLFRFGGMNYVTHLYLHLGKDTQANMLKLCLAILGTIQVVVPAILMYLQVTKHDEAEIKIAQLKASAHAKAKHKHKKHHKK